MRWELKPLLAMTREGKGICGRALISISEGESLGKIE